MYVKRDLTIVATIVVLVVLVSYSIYIQVPRTTSTTITTTTSTKFFTIYTTTMETVTDISTITKSQNMTSASNSSLSVHWRGNFSLDAKKLVADINAWGKNQSGGSYHPITMPSWVDKIQAYTTDVTLNIYGNSTYRVWNFNLNGDIYIVTDFLTMRTNQVSFSIIQKGNQTTYLLGNMGVN